jgi:acyl-homoserine-lactone acylase
MYSSVDPQGDSAGQGVPVGYGQVLSGSSTVMQVELTPNGPRGTTILTYSESENPQSEHHADQTRLFARRKWIPLTFTVRQIRNNAKQVTKLP